VDSKDLDRWFEHNRQILETAYLSNQEPWRQSGMSGPEERWVSLRKPVADCIDRPGSFLDIGCANGYLLECSLKWTSEQGIRIDPYGLDLSASLVEMARQRMPQFADHFFVGNAYFWKPSRRFDFVRTELVYVPAEHEKNYIKRLVQFYLEPDGKLLVANYGEDHPDPAAGLLLGCYPAKHLLERLAELGIVPLDYRDGYDPIKGRKVRVAILSQNSILF
jgi:SAM-dependent methyltransferase